MEHCGLVVLQLFLSPFVSCFYSSKEDKSHPPIMPVGQVGSEMLPQSSSNKKEGDKGKAGGREMEKNRERNRGGERGGSNFSLL